MLESRETLRIRDESRQLSAVLIPIYSKQGEYHVVFTQRTDWVKDHKGQISFPGGVYQEGDDKLINTDLREAAEQIVLAEEKVEILGSLDDVATQTSNYIISPFVGLIPWPYEFKVSTEEIKEVIEVPISALMDKSCLRKESEVVTGKTVTYYSYHYRGRVIWGATAGILRQFLDILTQATGWG